MNTKSTLPYRLTIEVSGSEWDKNYLRHITVRFDDEETRVQVELRTIVKPVIFKPTIVEPTIDHSQPNARIAF